MKKRLNLVGLMVVLAAVCLGLSPTLEAKSPEKKETFTGTVLSVTAGRLPSSPFTIYVYDYTTPEEAKQFGEILKTKGDKALANALSKPVKGRILIGNRTGYDIGFIRTFDTPEGGRIVRMATNRPIAMREVWGGARSLDYQIGLIEFKLDAEGKGEGTLAGACEIEFTAENSIKIKNIGIQPAKMLNIRTEKPKEKK